MGICSKRDHIVFQNSKEKLIELLNDFATKPKEELYRLYDIGEDSGGWKLDWAIDVVRKNVKNLDNLIMQCHYRPFDFRWTFYIDKNCGFMARPVYDVFEHMIHDTQNKALMVSRQSQAMGEDEINSIFVSDKIVDLNLYRRGGEQVMPLYLHNTTNAKKALKKSSKTTNESHLFVQDEEFDFDPFEGKDRIENFTPEFRKFIDEKYGQYYSPEEILGYIYAVLFHRDYREKYLDFLKIDYPRIPFSDSKEKFLKLSNLGQKLIKLHLMDTAGGGN